MEGTLILDFSASLLAIAFPLGRSASGGSDDGRQTSLWLGIADFGLERDIRKN